MDVYINIDEITEAENPLTYLLDLKERYPDFKATIFVALMRCSVEYVELLKSKDWLEVAIYGFYGKPRELEFYNASQLNDTFNKMEIIYTGHYDNGFKAPQFAYTDYVYQMCLNKGLWIEMHPNHTKPFLTGLEYCQLAKDPNIFEFSGHANNNMNDMKGIKQSYNLLTHTLDHIEDKEFKFCSDNLQVNP